MVPPGQLRVGRRFLGEVRALLRRLQEQEQAALPEGLGPVLQAPHQLQRLPQPERGEWRCTTVERCVAPPVV